MAGRAARQPVADERGRLCAWPARVRQLAQRRRAGFRPGAAHVDPAAGATEADRAAVRRRPAPAAGRRRRARPRGAAAAARHWPAAERGGRHPPRRPAPRRIDQGHGEGSRRAHRAGRRRRTAGHRRLPRPARAGRSRGAAVPQPGRPGAHHVGHQPAAAPAAAANGGQRALQPAHLPATRSPTTTSSTAGTR